VFDLTSLGWDDPRAEEFRSHARVGLTPGRVSVQHRGVWDVLTAGAPGQGGADRFALAGAEALVTHVREQAFRVGRAIENSGRRGIGQLDSGQSLECQGGFLLLVGRPECLVGAGGPVPAGSRGRGPGGPSRDQGGNVSGQGPELVFLYWVEFPPGATQPLEPVVQIRISLPGSRLAIKIGDQVRSFGFEIG